MIVYGKRNRRRGGDGLLLEVLDDIGAAARSAGPRRHDFLIAAFIGAAQLWQGVADEAFDRRGCDDASPTGEAAGDLTVRLARAVAASWDGGFGAAGPLGEPMGGLEAFARSLTAPIGRLAELTLRTPEGFAFYAVYPEAYLVAARTPRLAGLSQIVGLRSIGTGLGAMVAAAHPGARLVTVRPVGEPFERTLALSDALAGALAEGEGPVAVVDEGPGLSGSSFGGAADALARRCGVSAGRLVFFPSHGGEPGGRSSPSHRRRWKTTPRLWTSFETLWLEGAAPRLAAAASDLVGPPQAPLRDLSGGAWRALAFTGGAWPPADPPRERRKVLLTSERGRFLLKFAGLGRLGQAKLEQARALHRAGFCAEPMGLRHGFLIERWEEGSPFDLRRDRGAILGRIADYLSFRVSHLAGTAQAGAALPSLIVMARANLIEAGLAASAAALDLAPGLILDLGRAVRPMAIDGRLHAWEWLRAADGRLIKTDALDHQAAHDLIGGQDIAWDIAGAAVEFDLSEAETRALAAAIGRDTGRPVDPRLLAASGLIYIAFQIGLWTFALEAADAAERPRITARLDRYRAAARLHPPPRLG